jgi:hypothetical protein
MADDGQASKVFNAQNKIQIAGQLHELVDIIRTMPSTSMALFLQVKGSGLISTIESDEINHSGLGPLHATRIYVNHLLEFTYAVGSLAQSILRHDNQAQQTIHDSTIVIWAQIRAVDRNNPKVSDDIYNRMFHSPFVDMPFVDMITNTVLRTLVRPYAQ